MLPSLTISPFLCIVFIRSKGTIIVACHQHLTPYVTNVEIFEGSGGAQEAAGGSGGFVTSRDVCAVSLCIAEASFLFLNWPAVVQPASGGGGLSLSQIDAMVTLCPSTNAAFSHLVNTLFLKSGQRIQRQTFARFGGDPLWRI